MEKERFKVIYMQDNQVYMISILEDTETGKQYLLISEGAHTAICPLWMKFVRLCSKAVNMEAVYFTGYTQNQGFHIKALILRLRC